MTFVMVLFIGFTLRLLILNLSDPPELSLKQIRKNETIAYENLERIIHAQEAYFSKSRDLFGKSSYAAFLTHLWTGVDLSGNPVKLDLIPEKLAVAVGPTKAEHGYYFVDLRERHDSQKNPVKIKTSWAIAAIPRLSGRTGRLVFLTDGTKDIFAIPAETYASRHPLDPVGAGWTLLPTIDDLKTWQRKPAS